MRFKKTIAGFAALMMVMAAANGAVLPVTGTIGAAAQSEAFVKAAFEPEAYFVVEDRDGDEYIIPDTAKNEDDTTISYSLDTTYDKVAKLIGDKELYDVKLVIRPKTIDLTKTYGFKYIVVDNGYEMPSSSFLGDDRIGYVLGDYRPQWHEEYEYSLRYKNGGRSREPDSKVQLTFKIVKDSMYVKDMSDISRQYMPENRKTEHQFKVDGKKIGFDYELKYYVVDKDGKRHPVEHEDKPEETKKYIFLNETISADEILKACPADKYDYMMLCLDTGDMGGKTSPFGIEADQHVNFKDDGNKHFWGYSQTAMPFVIAEENKSIDLMKMDIFGNSANEDANMTNVESIESSIVIDKSVITILDSSKPEDKVTLGDVNADEKINVTDIAMTASHIKGIKALDDKGFKAADVNGDNKVNVTDIAMIASHIKGIKALG